MREQESTQQIENPEIVVIDTILTMKAGIVRRAIMPVMFMIVIVKATTKVVIATTVVIATATISKF